MDIPDKMLSALRYLIRYFYVDKQLTMKKEGVTLMNKIITISREFGSGGRELGKRLAEILGIAYYDNEIITGIAKRSGLAEEYVSSIVEKKIITYYPITIGRTFRASINPQLDLNMKVYSEQSHIIKELASKSDCVMIGRCSEYILREYNPLKIFVYADMDSRLERCRQRATEDEHFTDVEMKRRILSIDKDRAKYYKFFTHKKWGTKENYTLCINTSNTVIKDIASPIAELLKEMLDAPENRR